MSNDRGAIRLLIADDSDETRDSLRKLLSLEDDVAVVGEASNGLEALELARTLRPHIVLMDVRMPEMDGFGATEAIAAELPEVQVIMMSVAGTADILRRAMLAGGREFLLKPFEPDELVAAVRRVHEQYGFEPAPPRDAPTQDNTPVTTRRQGSVVAVFSPKGGVGCTTVACNLAVALAGKNGKRVALVDAGLRFGDVAMTMSIRNEHSLAELAGVATPQLELDLIEDVLTTHKTGVRVLLPPPTPTDADGFAPEGLRRVVMELRKAYDCVVVDVPSAMNEAEVQILDEADKIVTLFTLEMTTLKNVKLFLDLAKARDYPKGKVQMVASRIDETGGVRLADAEANLHFQTALCIRSDPKLATLALNKGTPFVVTHSHSALAQSIQQLAELVETEAGAGPGADEGTPGTKKKGKFGLLSPRQGKGAAA